MFKIFKLFLMLTGLAIVLVMAGLWYALSEHVYTRIVDDGTALTGTAIALDGADCLPVNGHISCLGLVIANPAEFRSSYAMRWGEVQAATRPLALLDNSLEIESLTLADGEIMIDGRNLARIQEHLEAATGSQQAMKIRAIKIVNCKVHRVDPKNGAITKTTVLPTIQLQDYEGESAALVWAELLGDVVQIVESEG